MKLIVARLLAGKGATCPDACLPYFDALTEWCVKHDVPRLYLRGYLDENRNQALLQARQLGYTHVAMLDNDHKHPGDTLERLWQHVQDDPSRMVVAGGNVQSGAQNRPLFGLITKSRRTTISKFTAPLIRCDWTALCAAIINVKVCDLWPKPWFRFDYDAKGRWVTEDVWFCDHLHEHGVPVYVDTTLSAPHAEERYADLESWKQRYSDDAEDSAASDKGA